MSAGKGCFGPIELVPVGVAGFLAAIANPEEADVIVTRVIIDVTTEATGAANMRAGVGATATTNTDNLITDTAVGAAPVVLDSADTAGRSQKWEDDQFITIRGSADTTGLVGNAYVEYIRV